MAAKLCDSVYGRIDYKEEFKWKDPCNSGEDRWGKMCRKQWHLLSSGAFLKTRHVFIIVKRIIHLIIHVDRSNGEAHFMQYLLHMSTLIAPIE